MTSQTTLQATLLGEPSFSWQGKNVAPSSRKALALLCYLSCQREAKTRDHLAELLWGPGKLSNLRQALYELRQLPGAERWLRDELEAVHVDAKSDVLAFEDAVQDEAYGKALEHHQALFLNTLKLTNAPAFTDWLELERARLAGLYREARSENLAQLEAKGAFDKALDLARSLLEDDPLNESAHRTVMRLEHRRGKVDAALEQFERCREVLRDELGVEPLPETLSLLQEIEQGGETRGKAAQLIEHRKDIPSLPELLFGRDATLKETLSLIRQGENVLLHGLGGAGKTALTAHVMAEHLTEGGKVLWLELGNEAPEAAFDAIAKAFDAQQALAQAATGEKPGVIRKLLMDNSISLLVLDDVWNAYTLSKVSDALQDLPLLVTSRQRYPRLKRLSVGRLDRDAALALLSHYAETDFDVKQAERLCDLLGDHAFALRIAGVTLKSEGIRPQTLAERIGHAPHLLSLPEDFRGEGRESIASLLQVSLDALDDQAYEAFVGFGGLFTPSVTPELMALALRRDEDATEAALFRLVERGLAERVVKPGSDALSFRVHDLAHSYARLRSPLRSRSVVRAAKAFAHLNKRAFDTLELELGNLLGAAEAAEDEDLVALMDALVVGEAYYQARGHSPRSLDLLVKAVDTAKNIDEQETAHYLAGRLGDTYRELLGNFEKARVAYEESLELARVIGNSHREAVMFSLIGVTRFRQEADDADDYFDKAYELANEHKDDLALGYVLQHRGFTAHFRERWEDMRQYSSEVIEVATRLKTKADIEVAKVNGYFFFGYLNLGEAEYRLARPHQAIDARKKALDFAKENNNQIWEAHALKELGNLYHNIDKKDSAIRHYLDALKLYKENNAFAQVKRLEQVMSGHGYAD